MRRVLFAVVCVLLALLPVGRLSAQGSGSPILAIGDSITAGTAGPSYLCPLKTILPGAAFVGPQPATSCGTSHAGYGGYVSAQILSSAKDWVPYATGATVVIHIGTNDVYSGFDLDRITIPNIRQIIQKAQSANPRAIILAQIIPSRDNPMTDINTRLAALARETGVRLVDAGNCFRTNTDMIDKVHPNDHGAEVISANIAAAIRGSAPPSVCDQTAAPEPPVLQNPNSNATVTLSRSETVLLNTLKNAFGLDLTGLINLEKLPVPDLSRFTTWVMSPQPMYLPLVIQPKIKHFTTPQAATSKYCVNLSQTVGSRVTTKSDKSQNTERTEPVTWMQGLVEGSSLLNALVGRKRIPLDANNQYNFDRPNAEITDAACGANDVASPQQSQDVTVTAKASLTNATLTDIVANILSLFPGGQNEANVNTQASVTRSTVLSSAEQLCNAAGCTADDVVNAPNKDELVNNGGWGQAWLSRVHQNVDNAAGKPTNPPTVRMGQETFTIDTPFAMTNRTETILNKVRCSLLPQALQQKAGLDCQTQTPSAPAACGNCTTANAECDKRAGQYTLKSPVASFGCSYSATSLGISSPTLSGYFESVGNFFGVPPQLLAGIAAIETRGLALTYTESFVQNASRADSNSYDVNFCKPPTSRNFCGALGIMQVSTPVCMGRVEQECPVAVRDQNWTEWCSSRNAPGEFRNLPGYQANPANILDSLVVGASVLKKHVGAGCPAKTSLTKQTVMEVGRSYYGNCAGRDTPTPGQYVSPELLQKLPRFLPSGVSASSFIDIPMRQALSRDGQYSTSTAGLTYCEFLWGYYSTH